MHQNAFCGRDLPGPAGELTALPKAPSIKGGVAERGGKWEEGGKGREEGGGRRKGEDPQRQSALTPMDTGLDIL